MRIQEAAALVVIVAVVGVLVYGLSPQHGPWGGDQWDREWGSAEFIGDNWVALRVRQGADVRLADWWSWELGEEAVDPDAHEQAVRARRNGAEAATRACGVRIEVAPVEVWEQGGSSSLVYTLAAVDETFGGRLSRGRVIAASGLVRADGTVQGVLGLDKKVPAAEEAGAELLIVATEDVEEARLYADAVEIIGVGSVFAALDWLESGLCPWR